MPRFVRFRSQLGGADSPRSLGVFYATDRLMQLDRFDPWALTRVEEICEWFNEHLRVPRLGRDLGQAVFWFRAECRELIQHVWELAILLEQYGASIELIQTRHPGWIRYVDEFQVAAVPTRR